MTLTTTNGDHAQVEASETDKKILAELERKRRVAAIAANGWKVELPSGETATLIDPAVILERRIEAIKVAMTNAAPDGEHLDAAAAMRAGRVTVAAFLASWTHDLPLPPIGNPESLLDLTARDYRTLSDAVADVRPEAMEAAVATPEALQNPASPFTGASG